MKNTVLGILIFFIHSFSFAQTYIDSLELRLQASGSDSSRIYLLTELSNKYLANQPPKAKQYAQEALVLSKSLGSISGEIEALNRLGEYEFRQSNYAMAVDYSTQSLALAEKRGNAAAMARAYRVLGNINTFGFKQYDLALEYQLKAFSIYEAQHDMRNIASFCGNITWLYAITNRNLKEAHKLADRGIQLSDSLGDNQFLSYNYNSKGLIYMQEGKLDSAIGYLNQSIKWGTLANDAAVIAYDKSILGNLYLKKRNYTMAIQYLQEALVESRELNVREVLKESYLGLAKSYEALSNYELAYKYNLLFNGLKDSLVNWETTQKALSVRLLYDAEKREAKISELELANQLARKEKFTSNLLYAVALLFMSMIIGLVIRNNKQRSRTNQILQKMNTEIAEQNAKLIQANEIKDKLFSILGHDLRSPLVSLKGLMELVLRNEVSEQEFKAFSSKLNQQVSGTHETLENILQWSHAQMNGWQHSPVSINLHTLVNRCTNLFEEPARAKNITLLNQLTLNTTIHADEAQLELIVRNLIHNAIKFTGSGGQVRVQGYESKTHFEIQVIDTGVGLTINEINELFKAKPSNSSRGTQGERGTGLGLMLCKEMIENNGGYLKVTSQPGKGSTFHVFIKNTVGA